MLWCLPCQGRKLNCLNKIFFLKLYNSTFYHFIISQLFKTKIDYLFVSNFSQGPHFSNVNPFLFLKIAYCLHLSSGNSQVQKILEFPYGSEISAISLVTVHAIKLPCNPLKSVHEHTEDYNAVRTAPCIPNYDFLMS